MKDETQLDRMARIVFSAFYDEPLTEGDFNDPRYASSRVASERAAVVIVQMQEAALPVGVCAERLNAAILSQCDSPRICSNGGRVTKGIRCGPCEYKLLLSKFDLSPESMNEEMANLLMERGPKR